MELSSRLMPLIPNMLLISRASLKHYQEDCRSAHVGFEIRTFCEFVMFFSGVGHLTRTTMIVPSWVKPSRGIEQNQPF